MGIRVTKPSGQAVRGNRSGNTDDPCGQNHAFANSGPIPARRTRRRLPVRQGGWASRAANVHAASLACRSGRWAASRSAVRFYDPTTGQFLTRDPAVSMTRSAYGYVHGDPLNATDPSGLYCITGVKGHDENGEEICNGASEVADNAVPDVVSGPASDVKDWMQDNARRARENSSIPGWARFTIKVTASAMSVAMVEAACAVGVVGAPVTGGGSLAICVGAVGLAYVSNATVGYVVDNNKCLSWEGWARSLLPDQALGSWLQWPPW